MGSHVGAGLLEAAAFLDDVRYLLAGFLAAGLAGVGGDQADLPHFGRPFLVVVAGARRLAVMVLPEMHHFMHQRREHLGGRPAGEVGGVEGDFVRHLLRVGEAGEALAGEIAVGSLVPLHGDQARRELAGEQLAVEMVIGGV